MPLGYREFEFDLPEALLARLFDTFEPMERGPLTPEAVSQIPEEQGVYQLFHKGTLVYIGKTDAEAGLRQRLGRHAWTIQHRMNLDTADVNFKAIRVFVFTAIDLETQLIKKYQAQAKVAWNFSGFGSNDPGRERDTTNAKPDGFDAQFPVDLDRAVETELPSSASAFNVLVALRKWLPYTLRFEPLKRGSRKAHPDLDAATVTLPPAPSTTRQLLTQIVQSLPAGWQCTLLPGRVILYKESRDYQFGQVIATS